MRKISRKNLLLSTLLELNELPQLKVIPCVTCFKLNESFYFGLMKFVRKIKTREAKLLKSKLKVFRDKEGKL